MHDIRVPLVPAAKRVAVAESTRSRSALPAETTAATPLVAHVRTQVKDDFSMLGVTWAHDSVDASAVEVAARARHGSTWSPWASLHVDPDEGPSSDEETAVRDGTEPLFVGTADAVEIDVYSAKGQSPPDLTVAAIDPGTSTTDATAARSTAATKTASAGPARDGFPGMPTIVTRRGWGADERLGDACWAPRYGSTFKAVFVHHTAGSNSYTRRESASVVRGVYAYHTQSRGWCDIGYNFLVDRYGTVYEGRAGGLRKPVRGAHSGDYNVDSTGISLMGEFTSVRPTAAMRNALVKLVAWRLGTAYHRGIGSAKVNGKTFKRISGHRDAMSTSCPGEQVYEWLPVLRTRVDRRLDGFASAIKKRWLKIGGDRSTLGPVRMGEVVAHGGHHTTFRRGRMYSSTHGRHTLRVSPLLAAYVDSGETGGPLGYPASRVRYPSNGLAANFARGHLYWSPNTKSRILVRGPVLKRYRHLHGVGGRLGFPETRVVTTKSGARARFQHGTVTFHKSTKRTTVKYR